jgi:hypothetical protein
MLRSCGEKCILFSLKIAVQWHVLSEIFQRMLQGDNYIYIYIPLIQLKLVYRRD